MNRDQTAHEELIPWLVGLIGARTYLEFGTHANETIGKVKCEKRYGVDIAPRPLDGAHMFAMTTAEFIANDAAKHAPYDFLFIDACHDFDVVNEDFHRMWQYISPEGLVCAHDTNPETQEDTAKGLCSDSWKLPIQLKLEGAESITLPYHPGLTIVRKRVMWGAFR